MPRTLLETYLELLSPVRMGGQEGGGAVVSPRGLTEAPEVAPRAMAHLAVLWPSVATGKEPGRVQRTTIPGVVWAQSGVGAAGGLAASTAVSLAGKARCYAPRCQ